MSDIDSASTYMAAARRDAQALANMLDESLFPLEIFGFHAQQTIEKCLKAWLCLCDIDPPQSHNLRHLLVLLESSGIQIDDWWEMVGVVRPQWDCDPNGTQKKEIVMMQYSECKEVSDRAVKVLSTEQGLKLAVIYGSAATGRLRADSDIDLALLFDHSLDAAHKMELAVRLEKELLRTVDLVDLSTLSGTILKQVLCKGQVLIEKEKGLLVGQIKKMIYNQSDMMPYVTRTLLERQRRFIDG